MATNWQRWKLGTSLATSLPVYESRRSVNQATLSTSHSSVLRVLGGSLGFWAFRSLCSCVSGSLDFSFFRFVQELWYMSILYFSITIAQITKIKKLWLACTTPTVRKCELFALGVRIERDIMWQLFFVWAFFWRADFLSLNFILRGLYLAEYLDNLFCADLKFCNILLKSCFWRVSSKQPKYFVFD